MAKITVMGKHATGKQTIVSAFSGVQREQLEAKASRWISQVKASKDGVDLQGLPREHGRMSAYRHRMAAINESDAFVMVLRNSEPSQQEYYYELVAKTIADKEGATMGPWLVICGYITDEVPAINPSVAEWANSINATVELLNVAKLSSKDDSEMKKLDSIIRSFAASIADAPKVVPQPKPDFIPASWMLSLRNSPYARPIKKPSQITKLNQETSKPVELQLGKMSRALSFLTRSGAVA